ncbi:MAG: glycosyltransferase family 9 protein [Candidatus Woesearchaeota archaeon]
MLYKSNCRYFRGHIPCKPHKDCGVVCDNCNFFDETLGKILIIKLGAIGDVIRTTPLLHRIKKVYPHHSIWWLTLSPEVVPSIVDEILPFNLESVLILENTEFDWLINLDKDSYACALASKIHSKKKSGFQLQDGKPSPINDFAKHKFITGLFDNVNKENKKNYLEEIFEICELEYQKEEYILDKPQDIDFQIKNDNKIIVGLNTGCGGRWTSRLWKEEYWAELIQLLQKNNFYPILLGGQQENEKNQRLSKITGCFYPGYFPLKEFFSLVNSCDIIVTAVTMALHIAIGLKKKVVLINNIFNPNEFELFDRGVIIEPKKPCKCFFSPECKNKDYFCLDSLKPSEILNTIIKNIL